jgi:2-methylisocitrate lyase-like PEP mutase family enzyme
MSTAQQRRVRLRELIGGPGIVMVPGVATALNARLAEQAGFEVVFATGSGMANTIFGLPDLGLVSMREVVDLTRLIVDATDLPVIADADTGYGNHLNVVRTTREMEATGVAAMVLEDQVTPKRCGHFAGKAVVSAREMVEKLVAAVRARRDPEMVIVARTDAIAVEGLAGALDRARLYVTAGADVVFVEAPRTLDEVREIPRAVPAPCLINIVEGGRTPLLPAAELEEAGYRFALYANVALRAGSKSVEDAFAALRRDGGTAALIDRMQGWARRQESVDLPGWEELDTSIGEAARRIVGDDGEVRGGS